MSKRTTTAEILELLGNEARRMRVGQKLPDQDPLPFEAIARVRDDFAFLLEQPGVTLDKVSRAMGRGYGVAVLSTFKRAQSRDALGDIDRVTRGVNRFIEGLALRGDVPRPEGFVETEVARRMLTVIERTAQLGAIGLIFSDAGRGKTITLQAASMLHTGSILVRIRRATRTPSGMAKHLAEAMRLRNAHTTRQAESRLVEALSGTRRLLLIDEAHQLNHDGLEFIRDIHDEAHVPVVLAGTMRIAEACDDQSEFFGQMSSRIAIRYDVTEDLRGGAGGGDPKPLHSIAEIVRMFESDKLKLTDDGRDAIARIANTPGIGGLRLCQRILQVAAAAADGEPIGAALIEKVMRGLHGREFATSRIGRAVERSKVKVA